MAGLEEGFEQKGKRMRIGIFGGTFDPPHLGHLILAEEVREQLTLDQILWVLTPIPPHKPNREITPLDIRLSMLKATIDNGPNFILSRVEIDRNPPYYAVDTVRILKEENQNDKMIYIMGEDSLRDLPTWHQPRIFVSLCSEIAVVKRPKVFVDFDVLERSIPGITKKVIFVGTTLIEISSSNIRERVSKGRTYRYFLPNKVYELIKEHKLYRKGN